MKIKKNPRGVWHNKQPNIYVIGVPDKTYKSEEEKKNFGKNYG